MMIGAEEDYVLRMELRVASLKRLPQGLAATVSPGAEPESLMLFVVPMETGSKPPT